MCTTNIPKESMTVDEKKWIEWKCGLEPESQLLNEGQVKAAVSTFRHIWAFLLKFVRNLLLLRTIYLFFFFQKPKMAQMCFTGQLQPMEDMFGCVWLTWDGIFVHVASKYLSLTTTPVSSGLEDEEESVQKLFSSFSVSISLV